MTTKLGPPPITPISDLGWARLERDLWARLDTDVPPRAARPPSSPRPWRFALPVIAVAAAAVIVIGRREAAVVTIPDPEPSRVVAGESASSVSYGDVHVTLDPRTAVLVAPTSIVEHGAAWFEVAPRGERPPFVVRAGDATITVVGTRFRVTRLDEHIEVAVEHGKVRVMFHGTETFVGAHEQWVSDPQTAMISLPPPTPNLTPTPAPTKPPALVAPTTSPAGATPYPAVALSDQVRFERLAALEPRDPAAAITGYLALATTTSRWAPAALFAAGRLASERRDPRAHDLLSSYLQRFPAGANASDARQLLVRPQGNANHD
ncbi:MAG: FecR family protein [Proteobacteria bacterium]|nr:FecR family protein [Pseudomonadota bacterium]